MQELRKSQNQDLRADLAWSMRNGIQSRRLSWLQVSGAAASFSGLKGSEILWSSGVRIFHWSDSSLLTSLVDLQSLVLCSPFFTSCETMEFAETGHWRKDRPDLPVCLLMVLHVLRLECEKSMELTASSYRSCFFCPSRDSRDEVTLSESVPTGAQCIVWQQIVGSRKNPGMPSQCLMCPEVAISQRIHLWEGKKALPISLVKVLTLHWIAVARNLELWWRYEGRPMLWLWELS